MCESLNPKAEAKQIHLQDVLGSLLLLVSGKIFEGSQNVMLIFISDKEIMFSVAFVLFVCPFVF